MRRFVILLFVIVAMLIAAGPAVAHQDSEGDDGSDSFTLWAAETYAVLVAPDGTVEEEPQEEFEPTVGTRFLSIDTLYADEERTEEVGSNRIACEVVRIEGESEEDAFVDLLCQGVVTLDGQGDLPWQASVSFSAAEVDAEEPFVVVALTGGTGEFVAAGGEVAVFDETTEEAEAALSRYEVTLVR